MTTSLPSGSSILGTRVARIEDPRLLRGQATFTGDVTSGAASEAAHAVFLRSPTAHARIRSIDVSAAQQGDDVIAVITAADLASVDLGGATGLPAPTPKHGTAMPEPYLAGDTVRYVGQAIAVVVAESVAAAVDAAELILVDYEPLPAVVDLSEALRGETLLFPEAGTNVAVAKETEPRDDFFDGCEVVVRGEIVNNRVAPVPLEGRAGLAVWHGVGTDRALTMYLPNQGAQLAKRNLVDALGIDADRVRVITPDVGGAFGAKFGAEPDHVAVAAAAAIVGRPVRWVETRSENLTGMTHGRGQLQTVTIGGSRDGTVTAYRLDVTQDGGAYPRLGMTTPDGTALMAQGPYRLERLEVSIRTVLTTTTPIGAFRGAGRPEATAAVERAMDLFADEIGMDPAQLRLKNLFEPFSTPQPILTGATYDSGDYPAALRAVLAEAGYDELRAEQAARRKRRDDYQLGIGLSVYVEVTGGGRENATVTVHPDGAVSVYTGVSPHGQGHATAFAMIVSDQLGVAPDQVRLVWGDTDLVPRGGGTGGSRSLQLGGTAALHAARAVVQLAKERAADLWEIDPSDVVLDRDRAGVSVAGVPSQLLTFVELAKRAERDGEPALSAQELFAADGASFPFGAHVAVVEVDIATGKPRLRQIVSVDDAGTVLNPLLAHGQRHGGLAQGIAQALFEEVTFDEFGNPTAATLADYHIPTAEDLPSYTLVEHETPTPYNDLGAKGLGEAATVGATPAVQNAVIDAVSHLGVRHIDMPLTPQRVWRAIRAAEGV